MLREAEEANAVAYRDNAIQFEWDGGSRIQRGARKRYYFYANDESEILSRPRGRALGFLEGEFLEVITYVRIYACVRIR